jgi:hypothetical protein
MYDKCGDNNLDIKQQPSKGHDLNIQQASKRHERNNSEHIRRRINNPNIQSMRVDMQPIPEIC